MEFLKSIVSNIVVHLKKYVTVAVILVLALFGYKACERLQKKQDSDAKSTVLKPNEKSKIIVDPVNHKITTVTRNLDGTTKSKDTYLPDRPSVITEDNNGKVTVETRKFGVEHRPYIGLGGSLDGSARFHTGADLWYYKKLDLGAGLDFNANIAKEVSEFRDTRLSINASYNVYSNTSVALSVDNRKFVGVFLKVRL